MIGEDRPTGRSRVAPASIWIFFRHIRENVMEDEKSVKVTVVVDDRGQDDLNAVVSALREKGFELDESMDAIGILTGKVRATALDSLSTVAGVAAVEPESDDYRTQ
jgi:hypothetical protein